MSKEMSRRSFLKTGTAVAAGIAVAPNIIIAGEKTPKKEKKKKVAANELVRNIQPLQNSTLALKTWKSSRLKALLSWLHL